jgi:hypothetical protein
MLIFQKYGKLRQTKYKLSKSTQKHKSLKKSKRPLQNQKLKSLFEYKTGQYMKSTFTKKNGWSLQTKGNKSKKKCSFTELERRIPRQSMRISRILLTLTTQVRETISEGGHISQKNQSIPIIIPTQAMEFVKYCIVLF